MYDVPRIPDEGNSSQSHEIPQFASDQALSPWQGTGDVAYQEEAIPLPEELPPTSHSDAHDGGGDEPTADDWPSPIPPIHDSREQSEPQGELPRRSASDGPGDVPPDNPHNYLLSPDEDPRHQRAAEIQAASEQTVRLEVSAMIGGNETVRMDTAQVIAELALEDIRHRNVDGAEKGIAFLASSVTSYTESFPEACIAAINAGSTRAEALLRDQLVSERTIVQEKAERLGGLQRQQSPLLERSVRAAEYYENISSVATPSPTELIDSYVADADTRWGLTLGHHQRATVQPFSGYMLPGVTSPQVVEYRQHAAGVLDSELVSDGYVVANATSLLAETDDAAVRNAIVTRFLNCDVARLDPPSAALRALTGVGRQVLDDPQLASPERIQKFEELIRAQKQLVPSPLVAERAAIRWYADKARVEGASADQIMGLIDDSVGQMMPQPEEQAEFPQRAEARERLTVALRNEVLRDQAPKFIQAGRVSEAKQLVGAISDEEVQAEAFYACVETGQISEPEQLSELVSQEALAYNAELALYYELTRLRLQGSDIGLHMFAIGCVQQYGRMSLPIEQREAQDLVGPIPDFRPKVLLTAAERSFTSVAQRNPMQAQKMARDLAAAYRQARAMPSDMRHLTRWLVERGAVDEAEAAYNYIRQTSTSSDEAVKELWELAKMLQQFNT